jgi:hypothetical protein
VAGANAPTIATPPRIVAPAIKAIRLGPVPKTDRSDRTVPSERPPELVSGRDSARAILSAADGPTRRAMGRRETAARPVAVMISGPTG